MDTILTYAEYQFQLVQYLTQIDEKEKIALVKKIAPILGDIYLDEDKLLERLNSQLQLLNKIYQEKSNVYNSIFETEDFDIITQILHGDAEILRQYRENCYILDGQQYELNILLKEIQELQLNRLKQSEELAQQFQSSSQLSQSLFAHYINIDQKIQDNEKILESLKEIRFDCVFK